MPVRSPAPTNSQLSLDDLGTPLPGVTFCVIDLETTGGSAETCAITEIGAVKFRGGECIGTFQTLVNPGCAIPPEITILTGITQSMVLPAPRIEAVLPSLLEFIGDAVIVGHNVRFDVSFLQAALERDPATEHALVPFLWYKGFHAISAHRLAHTLWKAGRRDLALYLQSLVSEHLAVDIHPAARFGVGILLDQTGAQNVEFRAKDARAVVEGGSGSTSVSADLV